MLEVVRFVNSRFTSNTYIIAHPEHDNVWVVDPGDTDKVFKWMKTHSKTSITGILLTHVHFDHIYGMNNILEQYPECVVYIANDYGKDALNNPKTNGSKYTDEGPIVIAENAKVCFYNEVMQLWDGTEMRTINTPGHSPDSQCLLIANILFTGDTLIHNYRTVTKLKGGSEEKLKETVGYLSTLKGHNIQIYGGHEDPFGLDDYDLSIAYNKNMN